LNGGHAGIWKAAEPGLNVLSRRLPGWTEKNHEMPLYLAGSPREFRTRCFLCICLEFNRYEPVRARSLIKDFSYLRMSYFFLWNDFK